MSSTPAALWLALLNQKGGCGKTTLAVNLAAGLSRRGPTVLLDADPQGSAGQWLGAQGDGRAQAGAVGESLALAGPQALADGWVPQVGGGPARFVVVDCPPSASATVNHEVLKRVHWVLMPVLPSPVDLWASWSLVEAVQQARRANPGLQARLLINQSEPGSSLSAAMQTALKEFDIPALASVVRRRAAFRAAALEGVSVYDYGARGQAAVADVESVIEELLS